MKLAFQKQNSPLVTQLLLCNTITILATVLPEVWTFNADKTIQRCKLLTSDFCCVMYAVYWAGQLHSVSENDTDIISYNLNKDCDILAILILVKEADVGWGGNLNGHLIASYVRNIRTNTNKIVKPWSRLSAVRSSSGTQKNTQKPMWPWPLTYDLEIQYGSRGCRGTCSYKISSS